MKLHRIVPWWVKINPIESCNDDVTMTSFPVNMAFGLVNTISWPFLIQYSPNLAWLMEYSRGCESYWMTLWWRHQWRHIYSISLRLMFTKLDMIDNKTVLKKYIEWFHDDIISGVTVDWFRLEFSIFQTREYNNLTSFHLIFTKLDMDDNPPVLTSFIDWCHGDVIADVTVDWLRLEFSIFQACEYYNLRSSLPMFIKLDIIWFIMN